MIMREFYHKTIQLSPFDTYESRTSGYYPPYTHDTGVYEHQQSIGRTYYGNYGEHQVEVVHLCV
jgi:hypothetical protein